MKTKIIEAISFITRDNWSDVERIRKDVFEKLFGTRLAYSEKDMKFGYRWTSTSAKNRIINANDFGQGHYIFTMSYNQYYTRVIQRLYGSVVLVDEYTVSQFIEDLYELRRETKKKLAMHYATNIGKIDVKYTEDLNALQFRLKTMLNIMFGIFSCRDYGVSCKAVIDYARQTILNDAQALQSKGCVILVVNTDTIMMASKSIPVDLSFDTHNNTFNAALIGSYDGQYVQLGSNPDSIGYVKVLSAKNIERIKAQGAREFPVV